MVVTDAQEPRSFPVWSESRVPTSVHFNTSQRNHDVTALRWKEPFRPPWEADLPPRDVSLGHRLRHGVRG